MGSPVGEEPLVLHAFRRTWDPSRRAACIKGRQEDRQGPALGEDGSRGR